MDGLNFNVYEMFETQIKSSYKVIDSKICGYYRIDILIQSLRIT